MLRPRYVRTCIQKMTDDELQRLRALMLEHCGAMAQTHDAALSDVDRDRLTILGETDAEILRRRAERN